MRLNESSSHDRERHKFTRSECCSLRTGVTMLRALYEYTGEDEDELTFPEGAELELIKTDEGVDDGFWRGRYQGREGMFPAVVVEIIPNGMNHSSSFCESSTPILDSTLVSASSFTSPSPSSMGPSPVTLDNTTPITSSFHYTLSKFHPTSVQFNSAPRVRVQPNTPEGELERTWRNDSFEEYDDEEEDASYV
jgi:hypothetical protein